MIKRILFLGVISFGVAQEVSLEKEKALEQPKNYFSRGLFDHKTGITFIGYSRTLLNIKQHENQEPPIILYIKQNIQHNKSLTSIHLAITRGYMFFEWFFGSGIYQL